MSAEAESNGRTKRTGKWRRPPKHGGFSVKNSHTSAARIALQRKQAECLGLREQGYSYEQISEHFKRPKNTVFRWVSESMAALVREPSQRLLELELRRLDVLQSEIWENATNGDLSAIAAYLKIADMRARLCGLYPRDGHPSLLLNVGSDTPGMPGINVSFVLPSPKPEPPAPIDVTPAAKPDYSLPAIEGPRPRARTPFGAMWEQPKSTDWLK
jgi:hypothetical protein